VSEYYHVFHDRSERELMMATAELRRRHQNHQKRLTITAGKLASFLKEVEKDEALLMQRRRDAELRAVSRGSKGPERPLMPVIVDSGKQLQEHDPGTGRSVDGLRPRADRGWEDHDAAALGIEVERRRVWPP
jgi:hypothetical protein